MSSMELNKGVLIPTYIDSSDEESIKRLLGDVPLEDYYCSYLEMLIDNMPYINIHNKLYRVNWEIKNDTESCGFAEVSEHEDGTIEFFTYHYNGGGSVEEVIEDGLNK